MGGCNHDGLHLPHHRHFCHDFQTSLRSIKVSGTYCHSIPNRLAEFESISNDQGMIIKLDWRIDQTQDWEFRSNERQTPNGAVVELEGCEMSSCVPKVQCKLFY